jgi:predicted AAA+ superfamily ATPase
MNFYRHISNSLTDWKKSSNRKPLILRGARQVGKTTLIKAFAKSYKHSILINLEKPEHLQFFELYDDVKTIIDSLFLTNNIKSIAIENTLLFIDEIQESPKAIHLLRYFYEEFPKLHVIAAGSLLEFAMRKVDSFPVGRVEFRYLYPLNFKEYLRATSNNVILEHLEKVPIKPVAHNILLKLFNQYAIIGGMPEIIKVYLNTQSISDLPKVYESIWETYKNDVEKYTTNNTERKVIKHIMATAHLYVDKRIKFQNFGNSNYRSREVSEAMRNLDAAKIIQLIYPTTQVEVPIIPDLKKSPRLQFLDTGIINHTLGIQSDLLGLSDLSNSYKGAIIPHLVTQELQSLNTFSSSKPNFWVREKSQSSSEVDLVIQYQGKIIPIEIKSGNVGTLKSLHQFIDRTNHPFAIRVYAGAFKIEKHVTPNGKNYLLMNLPYYTITMLPEYLNYFMGSFKEN